MLLLVHVLLLHVGVFGLIVVLVVQVVLILVFVEIVRLMVSQRVALMEFIAAVPEV